MCPSAVSSPPFFVLQAEKAARTAEWIGVVESRVEKNVEGGVSFWQVVVGSALCRLCSVGHPDICCESEQTITQNAVEVDIGSNKRKRGSRIDKQTEKMNINLKFRLPAEERPRSAKWTNGCNAKKESTMSAEAHRSMERHRKGTGLF